MNCPYCDAALTRCAVLAHELRQIAIAAHRQHEGLLERCPLQPCQRAMAAIEKAGLEAQRD